jgi:hypothetical protein
MNVQPCHCRANLGISDITRDSDIFAGYLRMTIKLNTLTLTIFFAIGVSIAAAQDYAVTKDLQSEWKVFQNGAYEPFQKVGRARSVFFSVEVAKVMGGYLFIESFAPFTVFINGQLAESSEGSLRLKIDSLSSVFQGSVWQVSVFQEKIKAGSLKTLIESKVAKSSSVIELLPTRITSFRDFAIIGVLILMIVLIVITQLNPKLASDYFSVTKIFSVREGEETQTYSRITSSINILFYVYSSLMLGYYLMIIFHFLPSQYRAAMFFQSSTFWEAVIHWLQLSLIVLGLFFVKIVLIYGLSFVFGMGQIGGFHFFNWVRLLLGVFGVLSIVVFLYFITHGQRQSFYFFFLSTMAWVLACWIVLIVLKLWRQMDRSLFHLFSYICATELIPFLITLKVLYY